jgi:CheY-like chemotaxis protein
MEKRPKDVDPGFTERTGLARKATILPRQEALILIAEDHAVNQRVAQLMLQRAGYTTSTVWDGSQAVAACRTRKYDLVLMDCRMPEMDGLEATRHIRKLDWPQPAIIGVTAYIKPGYREQCLASGMDDYLPKPYHWQQLLQIVQKNLECYRQPASSKISSGD